MAKFEKDITKQSKMRKATEDFMTTHTLEEFKEYVLNGQLEDEDEFFDGEAGFVHVYNVNGDEFEINEFGEVFYSVSLKEVIKVVDDDPKTFSVWEGHMSDLMKKVNTIQKKCAKFGCDFTFKEIGEEWKDVDTHEVDPFTGKKIFTKCRFVIVQAEGTAVINDWEFVSSVEHTEAGNLFSKALTDVEIPTKYRCTDPICEHCNSKRIRKNTFIIRNQKTGEFKQVGNSCLKDFTFGMSASTASYYASIREVFEEVEDRPVGGLGWSEKFYPSEEVLRFTAETIRHFGFRKSEDRGDSTKEMMSRFFDVCKGNTKWWDDDFRIRVIDQMKNVGFDAESPEASKMVKEALEWIRNQEASNDYMHNLKVATSLEYVNSGKFGILVSLFPTFNRDLEVQAQKKAEQEAGQMSEYQGQVGDRLEIKVASVKCITSWTSCFDGYHETTTYVWKITDVNGNIFTWKTSSVLNEDKPPVSIKGTVKGHTEFRTVKQTELTRCKVQRVA